MLMAHVLYVLYQNDRKRNKEKQTRIDQIKFRLSPLECDNHVKVINARVRI
jgi:hypothetical protein